MPKRSNLKYLLPGVFATIVVPSIVIGLNFFLRYDGLGIKTHQQYNQEGELVPVSRIEIDGLGTIEECKDLREHVGLGSFKDLVGKNLDNIVSNSELPVLGHGDMGNTWLFYKDGTYIDVYSGNQVAVKKLAKRLEDNICNSPGQKLSFHQTFNQEMYGGNGILKPQYAPKQLRL